LALHVLDTILILASIEKHVEGVIQMMTSNLRYLLMMIVSSAHKSHVLLLATSTLSDFKHPDTTRCDQ